MKTEFEKKLNELLGARKERTLLMTDERYNELIAETKEANERRRSGLELSGLHYRRLKRFDVTTIDDREKLIQKIEKGQSGSEKIYFCMASEMFDVVHAVHLKIGHKKEKGMEIELKRKYCNVTREVIAIYLNLCEECAVKKNYKTKSLSIKPAIIPYLATRCQIDIIDMEAEPDGMHKFILNYQDEVSKFLILRPLKTKTVEEIADVLFDIFCLIGVPNVLLCHNKHGYCNKIIKSLSKNWNVTLVHGEPEQDSLNRTSQDIIKSLKDWKSEWTSKLRIIQSLTNHRFHPAIKRTPHEALFRNPQRNKVTDSYRVNGANNLKLPTEKQLKNQLALLREKLDKPTETTKAMLQDYDENINELAVNKCLTCKQSLNPEVVCWKCNGPLHFNCALTNDNSEYPFCQLCASKTVIKIHRRGRKRQLEQLADSVQQELSVFSVGDKVMVNVSEIDNDKTTSGTKNSILSNAVLPVSQLNVHRKMKSKS